MGVIQKVNNHPVSNVKWAWYASMATLLFSTAVLVFGIYFYTQIDVYATSTCEDALTTCLGSVDTEYQELRQQLVDALRYTAIAFIVLGIVLFLVGASGAYATAKSSVGAMSATMCLATLGTVIALAAFCIGIAADVLLDRFCSSIFQWENVESQGHEECTKLYNAYVPLLCEGINAGDLYCFADDENGCSCACDDTIDTMCHYIPSDFVAGGVVCLLTALGLCTFACNVCCGGICCNREEKEQIKGYAGKDGKQATVQ